MQIVSGCATVILCGSASAMTPPHNHDMTEPTMPDCGLVSADLPPGQPPPPFDPRSWSVYSPRSAPAWTITYENPTGPIVPFIPSIESNLRAACARWGQFIDGRAVTIDILVRLDSATPRATGGSASNGYVRNVGGTNVYQDGAAFEISTGTDPNGASPDAIITFGPNYLANELWFDPNPSTRTTPVPINRTDAVSVLLHELGHVLGFNGWRDNFNGTLPGNYMSPYDQWTTYTGDFFFTGARALSHYRGLPVPLTYGNAKHLGNNAPRPGSDLILDMMNGVVYYRGSRYDISNLDRAVLADTGLPISVPCGRGACASGPCIADFDGSGGTPDANDITTFFTDWLAGSPCADADCSGGTPDAGDINDFFARWLAGGC